MGVSSYLTFFLIKKTHNQKLLLDYQSLKALVIYTPTSNLSS
jgi:hypothetical protein